MQFQETTSFVPLEKMESIISHRIVHFDLKGAPWKVPYLKQVILAAKKWGATGCLFEWEDSFPYIGRVFTVGSLRGSSQDGLYMDSDIVDILQFTKDNDMEPIQLVQSIGHLEYVLKHGEFASLRELHLYPTSLCPTRVGGVDIIVSMIKQLLAKQPDAKFLHIGADEVWYYNKCRDCISKSNGSIYGEDCLFIDHIKAIVVEVKRFYPSVQILIWDDMLRRMNEMSINDAEMHKFVIPVVWNYAPLGIFAMDARVWKKYETTFPIVWAASAFKGANGGNQMICDVAHYVSNQEAWLQQINILKTTRLKITGIILTGWSRFDHYATLCELLPVSLPSLASCLRRWSTHASTPTVAVVSDTLPEKEWPGLALALSIDKFHKYRQRCLLFIDGEAVGTWLNPWQVTNQYTTAMQVTPIANAANQLLHELNIIRIELQIHLQAMTGPRSTNEWIHSNVNSLASRIDLIVTAAESRIHLPTPVIPLPEMKL